MVSRSAWLKLAQHSLLLARQKYPGVCHALHVYPRVEMPVGKRLSEFTIYIGREPVLIFCVLLTLDRANQVDVFLVHTFR